MPLTPAQTALLCAAFFLAGIVDAVCGGGGLLTLPAFLAVGFPAHMISGNTKLVALCSNITASITYALSGSVVFAVVLPATLFNIAGNALGAQLAMRRGARLIRPMFLGILALLFVRITMAVL